MKTLYIDSNQHAGMHELKHAYFATLDGYELIQKSLSVGDYMLCAGRTSVDTKASLQELWGNITGGKRKDKNGRVLDKTEHERFRDECIRAQEQGIRLYILTETNHVKNLDELAKWYEPTGEFLKRGGKLKGTYNKYKGVKSAHTPQRASGKRLASSCRTMQDRYGVTFLFCAPEEAGKRVIELLEQEETKNAE